MHRLWLIFAQTVTFCVAVLFVLQTLKPEWLSRGGGTASIVAVQEATPGSAGVVGKQGSYSDAAKRALPSVVHVYTSQEVKTPRNPFLNDPFFRHFFGDRFDLHALAGLLDENAILGDLGCGTAQVAATIAPFVKQVIAVDESAVMLKTAKQRLANLHNVDLRRGDLTALPIDDGQLDAAVIMLVLHHLPEPAQVLKEIARTIRPGGKLLLVDMQQHDRREYQQTMGHLWLGFDSRKLQTWLADAGFDHVRVIPLPQPTGARGPALFACTARKHTPMGRR